MTNRKLGRISAAALSAAILGACGGGGSPASPTEGGNSPTGQPGASFEASESAALASVTEVTFTASSSGMASYEWDFGDGAKASGQTVRKTYERAGSYQVALRVTDARGASASSSSSFVVKSLDGLWDDDAQQYGVKLTQSGQSLRGRTVFRIRSLTGATTGTVDGDMRITYSTDYGPGLSDSFEGRLDAGLDRITGKLTLHIFGVPFGFNMNFVRK
jgi:PKD repeat protein